jgi:plastocyanin
MRYGLLAVAGAIAVACAACSSSGSTSHHSSTASSSKPSTASSSSARAGDTKTGTTTGAANDQSITVHTTDMLRFDPSVITARVGTVHIRLVDDGSYPHDLDVMSLHAESRDVSGDPGQQNTTLTLHLSKPGTYGFDCTYHSSAGMKGKIVVRG